MRRPFPAHSPLLADRLRREHPGAARIDTTLDPVLQRAAEDLAATTRAAEAALASAEVQRDTARLTLERTAALAERNVASAAQLEQAQRAAAAAGPVRSR